MGHPFKGILTLKCDAESDFCSLQINVIEKTPHSCLVRAQNVLKEPEKLFFSPHISQNHSSFTIGDISIS